MKQVRGNKIRVPTADNKVLNFTNGVAVLEALKIYGGAPQGRSETMADFENMCCSDAIGLSVSYWGCMTVDRPHYPPFVKDLTEAHRLVIQ